MLAKMVRSYCVGRAGSQRSLAIWPVINLSSADESEHNKGPSPSDISPVFDPFSCQSLNYTIRAELSHPSLLVEHARHITIWPSQVTDPGTNQPRCCTQLRLQRLSSWHNFSRARGGLARVRRRLRHSRRQHESEEYGGSVLRQQAARAPHVLHPD